MLSPTQMEQIRRFAEEIAVREGCRLYDLEYREGAGRLLRVYIDKTPGGVSIDDCVNVSKGLNLRLDVEDVIPGGAYELEVSSPGLDRKLTQAWHFDQVVGQRIVVKYRNEQKALHTYEGQLLAIEDGILKLENAKGPFAVSLAQVEKGHVVLQDVFGKKPAPGKKKR